MKHYNYLLAAAVTLVVAACSNNDKDRDPPPPMANQAPTVSAITAKAASQDTVVGPIDFTVGDDVTPVNQVTVTATADGAVFAADGLVITGTGTTRMLTLTPLEAATGVANVTLTAIDAEGLTATSTFAVTVSSNPASVREVTLSTFAKGELADATPVNGFTFTQDADDPAVFDSLIGPE